MEKPDQTIRRLLLEKTNLLWMDNAKMETVYNLGLAYEAAGLREKAIEEFKEIYAYDMTYRDVEKRIEDSYLRGS